MEPTRLDEDKGPQDQSLKALGGESSCPLASSAANQ
jgi:hypothetical protein